MPKWSARCWPRSGTDGIDANLATTQGDTALIMASLQGHAEIVRTLLAVDAVDANHANAHGGGTAVHAACLVQRAEIVEVLLLAGGCRFLRDGNGSTPLDLADRHKSVLKVFASGVDYWQRRRHGGHVGALKEAVATLLLVRQRLQALAPAAAPFPRLPEEIWLAVCAFLRSADFVPKAYA